jgi:hypothetical protein
MKKLIYLVTFVMTTTILSCSKNDETNRDENSIIGIWYGISSTLDGNNSGVPNNNIIEFTPDNRVKFTYENFGNNGQDIIEFGSWDKNDNNINITWDNHNSGFDNYNLQIIELTDSKLKWETELSGQNILKETFNRNQFASVDISEFQDFVFNFSLNASPTIPGESELIECRIILFETFGNGEIYETIENFSYEIDNSTLFLDNEEIVKEFKVVGIKIEDITGNFDSISLELYRAIDGDEVLNTTQSIENSITIMYDFETGIETITSN